MKLRVMCLLLCLFMVFPLVLTSCGPKKPDEETTDEEGIIKAGSNKAMTITLYSITGDSTTDEAIEQVQYALNRITEKDFNTHILLKLFSEDEYDRIIDEKVEAIKLQIEKEEEEEKARKAAEKAAREAEKAAAKEGKKKDKKKEKKEEESTEETDETKLNEWGFEETVYPEEKGTQLDIFLIRDMDKLKEYSDEGLLTSLDEELSIGSKILKQYIHPTFLLAAKVDGKTCAIPNNHVIGEYQYLLLSKELIDKYYYDPDKIKGITDIKDFLLDVIKYEPDYIPLMNEPELSVAYLTDEPSLLGNIIPLNAEPGKSAPPKNLLTVAPFIKAYTMLSDLRSKGAIGDGSLDDGKKYAAAVISGDPTTPDLYKDDYYVSVYRYPTAENKNVYNGMYAISSYAAAPSRCMKALNYLTTNKEFINILRYGIENINYRFEEDGKTITMLNNDYSMKTEYAGNQFLMYPTTDMDPMMAKLAADDWKLAKQQNLDMVYHPYLGFQLRYKDENGADILTASKMSIKEIVDGAAAIRDGYLDQIKNFKEYEEEYEESYIVKTETGAIEERFKTSTRTVTIDDFMKELVKESSEEDCLVAAVDSKDENSPISQYNAWHQVTYPPAPTEDEG